jgi:hypothetical protein
MLTSKHIINRIDEIVELAYIGFIFDIVGDDFFTVEQKRRIESLGLIIGRKPLIELLYLLVRQRPTEGYRKDKTLTELLDQVALSGVLPVMNDVQQYSVDHGKAAMFQALSNAKESVKKVVKQKILVANQEYKQKVEAQRLIPLPKKQELKRDSFLLPLLTSITGLALSLNKDFVRAFTTELTGVINSAVSDAAAIAAFATGKDREGIQVYKEVKDDDRLCQWCKKFYTNRDGTPKIFLLHELEANGVNDPAKKSTWRPTVGATHPRCRCQLHYLK